MLRVLQFVGLIVLLCSAPLAADERSDLVAAAQRGEALRNSGNKAGAIADFETALPLARKLLGINHPAVGQLVQSMGDLYLELDEHVKAREMFTDASRIYGTHAMADPTPLLQAQQGLARIHEVLEQYEAAEPLRRKIVDACAKSFGADDSRTATAMDALGWDQTELGQFDAAEKTLASALAIRQRGPDKGGLATSYTLANVANLYFRRKQEGDFAKAEAAARLCLSIREANLPAGDVGIASAWESLANIFQFTRRQKEAAALYDKILPIYVRAYGKSSLSAASLMNSMALNFHKMGILEKARPLYEEVIRIQVGIAGTDHPATIMTRHNYSILLVASGDYRGGAEAVTLVRKLERNKIAQVLPALSEAEQIRYLTTKDNRRQWHISLSLGLLQKDDSSLAEASAEWLLNGKAMSQQTLSEPMLQIREGRNPTVAALLDRLNAARTRLASLTHGFSPAEKLAKAAREEQDLAKQVSRASGSGYTDRWITLDAVRKGIPSDAVLIEIVRFEVVDFQSTDDATRWLPARYAAWLIRPKGRVEIVDLGPAQAIDDAIAAVRKQIESAPTRIRLDGEPAAEKQLRVPLRALSQIMLKPLAAKVAATDSWIISPDGSMWLLPWEMLLTEDGKYLTESKRIRYVVTGRDLVVKSSPKIAVSAPLIVADPDFDLSREKATTELKSLVKESVPETKSRAVRGLALGQIPRLPGTAIEAELVTTPLEKYAGTPKVFTESRALEGLIKAVRNPSVLLVSTHGFFIPEPVQHGRLSGGDPTQENPLLRCGLLLAGCNDQQSPRIGEDDGVLTGLEIVGTDLRGTRLVVLSACETGLGEIRSGEGVAGLKQAFQLAGAETVVATLWQVPDVPSAKLMSAFFDNLAAGKDRDDALRAAQREAIDKRRERFGSAHPYFWAAYTLTGQAR